MNFQRVLKILYQYLYFTLINIWHVFLNTEQFQDLTKNKNSVSKKLTKKILKIYFEKIINHIILFCG